MHAAGTRLGEMRALRTASRTAAAYGRPVLFRRPHVSGTQRAGFRGAAPVRALLEQVVTTPDERLHQGIPLPDETPEQPSVKPGDDERTRFQLHWSVDMWKGFYSSKWLEGIEDESKPVTERIQAFTNTLTNAVSTAGILGSTDAARYWAYHLGRSGFFVAQAVAGLLAARQAVGRDAQAPALTRLENTLRRGVSGPLTEALLMYYQDHENIKEGKYALPWDMTTPNHRQFNPLFILQRAAAFVSEAADTLRRRDAGQPEEVWLKSGLLPDYFQNTFHYQTDGWLSAKSAKVYESSTETLFVGRQDAMQRCTLVPLHEFMQGKDASQLKALEVAGGTGRFSTFVKDNYPGLQLTVSDLSPFYLAEARSNMQYWKEKRAPDANFGGTGGTGVTFLQTAAEKLDVPDNSQDIVYSVYLFHELPADVRKQAISEMARVLKPGGIAILTDSVQLGDRDSMDATLGNFSDFNEPYYRSYINTPLAPLFEAAGLQCGMKVVGSTTKTLSFHKPQQDDVFALAGSAEAAAAAAAAEVKFEGKEDE